MQVSVICYTTMTPHPKASGYGRSGGTKATALELNAIIESMEFNELLTPTRLLTGLYKSQELFLAGFSQSLQVIFLARRACLQLQTWLENLKGRGQN